MPTEPWQIALLTAAVNAAATWGVISTKLAWLRRDIDELARRMDRRQRQEDIDA